MSHSACFQDTGYEKNPTVCMFSTGKNNNY